MLKPRFTFTLTAMAYIALASAFGGCASIEHTSTVQQPIGQTVLAGVGDVVLRVENYRNLENVVGKADIWGRKTHEGFTELRFAGVEPTGEVVLYRKDLHILTNETTMSRNPFTTTVGRANTSTSGTYGAGQVNTNTQTTFSSMTSAPTSDFHVIVPEGTIPLRLGPGEKRLPVAGYIVEIVTATPNSLEYRIIKQSGT